MTLMPLMARATTESVDYYLDSDGWPTSSLTSTSPPPGPVPDVDGDGKPGRRIDRSDKYLAEGNKNRYHEFATSAAGLEFQGGATLTIWVADKNMDTGDTVTFIAYLLDSDTPMTPLASASKTLKPAEAVWTKVVLPLGSVDHAFDSSSNLVLRLMVDRDRSEEDMAFAFDTTTYASKLTLEKVAAPPPTTTTTTSPTTTTTAPTTTTTEAITTTTEATTTTTGSTSTTSSTVTTENPSTTTTSLASTTTIIETTTTSEVSSTTSSADASILSPTTTTPSPLGDMDTEKTNLVIRTTPAQRGTLVASDVVELNPVEGLMVSFVTAAETVRNQLWSAVGLGLLMAGLLVVGMSKRRSEEDVSSSR